MSKQLEVIAFISEHTGEEISNITLDSYLIDDLGIDGDDGRELLIEFSKKFNLSSAENDVTYFNPEGYNPITLAFSGITAFIDGFINSFNDEDKDNLAPLSVRHLVLCADKGEWIKA